MMDNKEKRLTNSHLQIEMYCYKWLAQAMKENN
jgi:hypothetical protein